MGVQSKTYTTIGSKSDHLVTADHNTENSIIFAQKYKRALDYQYVNINLVNHLGNGKKMLLKNDPC